MINKYFVKLDGEEEREVDLATYMSFEEKAIQRPKYGKVTTPTARYAGNGISGRTEFSERSSHRNNMETAVLGSMEHLPRELILTRANLRSDAKGRFISDIRASDFAGTMMDIQMAHRAVFMDEDGQIRVFKDKLPFGSDVKVVQRPVFKNTEAMKIYLDNFMKD